MRNSGSRVALVAALCVVLYALPAHAFASSLVWGNTDGISPQQISIEDGGTYEVPLNIAAPAYIGNTTTPVTGNLYYIDTSGDSPVREFIATIFLHSDSGDESVAWSEAGSYELDILEPPPLPQLMMIPRWFAWLFLADVAYAQMAPPPPSAIETLHFTIQEAPPPCTEKCFSNVLFLPGIEASRLYRPQVVRQVLGSDESRLWPPSSDAGTSELAMTSDGTSIRDDIYTRDILDNAYVPAKGNVYRSFISDMDELRDNGTINDWKPIPYDWRLSLDDILGSGKQIDTGISYLKATSTPFIMQELKRLAGSSKSGKVTIIAHSNGGLLAKALMEKLGSDASRYVDKIIFVAVPQVGTPQAIAGLLHGIEQGLPIDSFPLFFSPQAARTLGDNMPGLYNLLPSASYFTYVDTPVVTFSSDVPDWPEKYGDVIHSQERLHTFLADTTRTQPAANDLINPAVLNEGLLTQAENMHQNLDAWTPPAGIELIQIAGWGVPDTVASVNYVRTFDFKKEAFVVQPQPEFTSDGDGTVVVPSALWTSTTAGAVNYWVNMQTYNSASNRILNAHFSRSHAGILEIDQVRDLVKDSITSNTEALPSLITTTRPTTDQNVKRLQFALHSPLTLNLYDDQGNHTGVSTTTGEIDEQVPGTYYIQFGDVKYIFADEGVPQHIVMSGYDTGTFTFEISEFQGDGIVASTVFKDVPVTPQTEVTFTVSSGLASASNLAVDENGDGTVDSTYASSTGQIIVSVSPEPQSTPKSTGGGGGGIPSLLPQATSTTTATTTATSTEDVQVFKQVIATTSPPSISGKPSKKIVQIVTKVPPKKKPVVVATSTSNTYAQSLQVASAAQSTGGGLWTRVGHWIMNKIQQLLRI